MIKRVHHIGIVVRDLAGATAFWRDTIGLPVLQEAELPDQGVRALLLACGSCEIELLEPTADDSGVARFLARHGDGLHHLCFESDDVGRELKRLRGMEVELIDEKPRKGLAGMIAFLHPRACAGILVEVATPTDDTPLTEAPLAVTVIHAIVENVESATQRYGDVFGLPVRISHPDWSVAQLSIGGGVVLQLASTGATSGQPGLSMLRLMTGDLDVVSARLDAGGVAYRRDAVGLVLGSSAAYGVPLVVHKPQGEKVGA